VLVTPPAGATHQGAHRPALALLPELHESKRTPRSDSLRNKAYSRMADSGRLPTRFVRDQKLSSLASSFKKPPASIPQEVDPSRAFSGRLSPAGTDIGLSRGAYKGLRIGALDHESPCPLPRARRHEDT
jgi:hypothetical protein